MVSGGWGLSLRTWYMLLVKDSRGRAVPAADEAAAARRSSAAARPLSRRRAAGGLAWPGDHPGRPRWAAVRCTGELESVCLKLVSSVSIKLFVCPFAGGPPAPESRAETLRRSRKSAPRAGPPAGARSRGREPETPPSPAVLEVRPAVVGAPKRAAARVALSLSGGGGGRQRAEPRAQPASRATRGTRRRGAPMSGPDAGRGPPDWEASRAAGAVAQGLGRLPARHGNCNPSPSSSAHQNGLPVSGPGRPAGERALFEQGSK
jgi:hypothetical protein